MTGPPSPRLSLSHATVAVRDLQAMLGFYCDVLGFVVTNRGAVCDGSEMAFLPQDPTLTAGPTGGRSLSRGQHRPTSR